MTARALIAGSYGDTTLPRIDLTYIRALPGAITDWAADALPLGPLSQWADLTVGRVLPSRPGSAAQPSVIEDAGKKVVRFDGIDDWMQLAYPMAQPMTTVILARIRTIVSGVTILAGGVHIRTNSANTAMEVTAGTALGTTEAPVNTAWRVYIIVNNGANSVMSVDGVEAVGNAGTGARTFVNLGINSSASAFMPIDYKRLAFLPYAASPTERAQILAQIRIAYGL